MMSENEEKGASAIDASTLISNLLSNPDAISKIGNIISKLSESSNDTYSPPKDENTIDDNNTSRQNESNNSNIEEFPPTLQNLDMSRVLSKLPAIISNFSSEKGENFFANKQQIALLLAIRPYLSKHRQELIDTFIKMNRLGAIFKNLT